MVRGLGRRTVADPLNDGSNDDTRRLRIKSNVREVTVSALGTDTVATLKRTVVDALEPSDPDPYVRLVCAGRLLAPDSASLDSFKGIQDDCVVHAVLADKTRSGAQAAAARSTILNRRALRGTGLDGRRSSDDEDDAASDGEDSDVEAGTQRRGFDRLRQAGLRRSEVTALRAYFGRQVDRWIRQEPVAAEEAAGTETDPMRRRLLQEEAWMATQGPATEFRLNLQSASLTAASRWTTGSPSEAVWRSGGMSASVGTDRDFMWGFMLGFFVGSLMLVWVWMPTVPHKQKVGILTGISAHLALKLMNQEETDDDVVLGD